MSRNSRVVIQLRLPKRLIKHLATLKKDLPQDVKIEKLFDSASFIKGSISNLTETLMYAGIFVILVVLFFLGRWRATFIVILTIPISLIVAFIYLFVTGASINIISLTSLSIAIGMVVDDAIVVLENITKHIERGSRPREAAIYATNEVWLAVIVTTLTVVAVFFPLTFVTGLTGVLFKQLGMIVTITISNICICCYYAYSDFECTHAEMVSNKKRCAISGPMTEVSGKDLTGSIRFYEKTLRWALHHKTVVSIMALVVFLGSMSLFRCHKNRILSAG